jgi:hypothetical protein
VTIRLGVLRASEFLHHLRSCGLSLSLRDLDGCALRIHISEVLNLCSSKVATLHCCRRFEFLEDVQILEASELKRFCSIAIVMP